MRRYHILFLLCTLLLLTAGCTQTHVASVSTSMDMPFAADLADMTAYADLVVIGTYGEELAPYNKNRDPADPTKPKDELPIMGRVFTFHIEEVLQGHIEEPSIPVILPWSISEELVRSDGNRSSVQVFTYQDPRYVQPEEGSTYLLFLCYSEIGMHYFGPIEPWSIKQTAAGSAMLCSGLLDRSETVPLTGSIRNTAQTVRVNLSMGSVNDFLNDQTFLQICDQIRAASAH